MDFSKIADIAPEYDSMIKYRATAYRIRKTIAAANPKMETAIETWRKYSERVKNNDLSDTAFMNSGITVANSMKSFKEDFSKGEVIQENTQEYNQFIKLLHFLATMREDKYKDFLLELNKTAEYIKPRIISEERHDESFFLERVPQVLLFLGRTAKTVKKLEEIIFSKQMNDHSLYFSTDTLQTFQITYKHVRGMNSIIEKFKRREVIPSHVSINGTNVDLSASVFVPLFQIETPMKIDKEEMILYIVENEVGLDTIVDQTYDLKNSSLIRNEYNGNFTSYSLLEPMAMHEENSKKFTYKNMVDVYKKLKLRGVYFNVEQREYTQTDKKSWFTKNVFDDAKYEKDFEDFLGVYDIGIKKTQYTEMPSTGGTYISIDRLSKSVLIKNMNSNATLSQYLFKESNRLEVPSDLTSNNYAMLQIRGNALDVDVTYSFIIWYAMMVRNGVKEATSINFFYLLFNITSGWLTEIFINDLQK